MPIPSLCWSWCIEVHSSTKVNLLVCFICYIQISVLTQRCLLNINRVAKGCYVMCWWVYETLDGRGKHGQVCALAFELPNILVESLEKEKSELLLHMEIPFLTWPLWKWCDSASNCPVILSFKLIKFSPRYLLLLNLTYFDGDSNWLCMMAMQLVTSSVMWKKQIIQQFNFSSTFFQVSWFWLVKFWSIVKGQVLY